MEEHGRDQHDAGEPIAASIDRPSHDDSDAARDGMPPEPAEDDPGQSRAASAPTPERLMVLLAGGPLLVDLYLTIDGRDWTQAAKSDRDDAATRYSGRKERSLLLDSSRSRYYEPRWHSRVWQLLDANEDGAVSDDEWQAAPAQLLARDADDDRIIYPQDLDSLRDQVRSAEGMATAMRSDAGLSAARLAGPDADWQLIAAVLSDLYAFGRPLRPDDFPNLGSFYAELDADSSGRLSSLELAEAAGVKAHLTLEVDFGASSGSRGARATLRVVDHSDEVIRVQHASPSRLALVVGNEGVDVSAHDRPVTSEITPAAVSGMDREAQRNQLRVFVHNRGDALMAFLDADHDGRLGEREIAHAPRRLQSLDKNADNRLTAGEVAGRMTVDVVRGSLPAGEARYHLPLPPHVYSDLRPPDWFTSGDFNGDGDISRREFIGTREQFGQLDLNEDGFVSAKEAAVVEVH